MEIDIPKKLGFQSILPIFCSGLLALGLTLQTSEAQEFSDTTPPQLVNFSIGQTNIDVTSAQFASTDEGVNLGFNIQFTDDLSGFSSASLSFEGPTSGQTVDGFSVSTTGDSFAGTSEGTIFFPQFIENGTWTIRFFTLRDRAGNQVSFDAETLNGLGFSTTVEVASDEDLDPPVINSITFSTTEVDVSDAPQDVVIDLDISDDPAGVVLEFFVLRLTSPTFSQTIYVGGRDFTLISGDENNGVWQATVSIPQHSEAGDWTVENSFDGIKDRAGNIFAGPIGAGFDFSGEPTAGLANIIHITSATPDTTPPVLVDFNFTPKAINTSEGPVTISATLTLQDDLSGVSFEPDTSSSSFVLGAGFRSPSAGQRASQRTFGGNTLTSGTNLDGTWEAPLTIRQFSEAGTWNLSRLRFKDTTNNVVSLRTTDFAALGIPTELVVIRPSLDADGTIGAAGGTVTDATFGDRAELSVPAGLLANDTAISIDVFQDPIDVPMPTGFSADGTRFVNVNFTPEPNFPVAVPGITITLPLVDARVPGSSLALFKIDTVTATLVPSISVFGGQVIGTVNADGLSATFPGVAGFSTVIGLPEIIIGDLNGDSCVDRADFTLLRAIYRNGNADLANDLNGDGVVNIADLRTLIRNFTNPRGASCDQPAP